MKFNVQQIAAALGGKIIGNAQAEVWNVASLENAQQGDLCFLWDEKFLAALHTTNASVVVVNETLIDVNDYTDAEKTLVLVENARAAMGVLLNAVAQTINPKRCGIEQPSFISEGVNLSDDVYVGAFAYIGKNAKIGKGVQIHPQVYIGDNVVIGDNTILYAGVKVYYNCIIGANCILHSGAVVGADGFGFEPDENGINQKIPQIGNVIIEDDVEVGANSTIDRAVMGSTIVRYNAKLDNLVHVAHNVEVGESTFMCGHSVIAGSTKVGKHCVLAGQVGISGHIEIADNCIFGAQTGVPNSIRKPGQYMGTPAIDASIWRRAVVGFKQLPDIVKKINKL